MYKIIDTPWNTSSKVQDLKNEGIETVIRYYDFSNSHIHPEKRLEPSEAVALSDAGLNIVVVFQAANNKAADFSMNQGHLAGQEAFHWAKQTIKQPYGSAIYFAVDFDASESELHDNIIPYFQGVTQAFEELSDNIPTYTIGAYGSGFVVNILKSEDLCEYRWLSMSIDFLGTRDAMMDGEYELHQISPSAVLCGLDVNYDVRRPGSSDIGSFVLR